MNNPNYPASGFSTQPQTSPVPNPTNAPPIPQDGNIQQLGSTQSSFVNQFVNENQQTNTQPANQVWPINNMPSVNPPVQAHVETDTITVPISNPAVTNLTFPSPQSLPKLEDNDDFALPSLNNGSSVPQNEAPVAGVENVQTQIYNHPNPTPQNITDPIAIDQQPVAPVNTSPAVNISEPLPNNSLPDQRLYAPALDNNQFQAPQQSVPPTVPNDDPQGIGTHQITVNEDYADFYNRQQAAMQTNTLNKQIEPMAIDFSRPATTLNVDQDFSDGGLPASDNSGISTGFLPAFDDTSDDGILPVVTDDDEDNNDDSDFQDVTGGNTFVPYGFSDFDPNEQDSGPTVDHLSGFESQSLEDTANKIDVDYSEQMPPIGSTQQSIGVFTQEPVVATKPIVSNAPQTLNYMYQTQQVANQATPMQQVGGQSFVPVNTDNPQMTTDTPSTMRVEPVVGELSPAAKLNQLLEAEEAAEKVVMQKQDQMLDRAPGSQQAMQSKVNVFKQLDPDGSLDSDLKSQMSLKKPSSKYFLIFSVVIIISIIGFLLVLLGLMLLN